MYDHSSPVNRCFDILTWCCSKTEKILFLPWNKTINIFIQDWPDCMAMDEKMFANYAEQLEKEDFEDEVCPED